MALFLEQSSFGDASLDFSSVKESVHQSSLSLSNAVFQNTLDGIVAFSATNEIVFANDTALFLFGFDSATELRGRLVQSIVGETSSDLLNACSKSERSRPFAPTLGQLCRMYGRRKSGECFPLDIHFIEVESRGKALNVAFIRDRTEIEKKEKELHTVAYFDALTGLPNGASFRNFITDLYKKTPVSPHVIVGLGVDHMRLINSSFGFDEGDDVIATVGKRLELEIQESAFFGRLFGDQFICAIPLEDPKNAKGVLADLGSRIESLFNAPVDIEGARVSVSITIGAITIPELAPTPELVTKHSEMAFGEAKVATRSGWHLLSRDRLDALEFSASLTHKLVDAIQGNEFSIVIQPKIDVASSVPSGGETLVRWTPRGAPPIRPDIFIPAAENAGLIGAIGRFVFLESCSTLIEARNAGHPLTKLAVNTSPHQLSEPGFFDLVESTLETLELEPHFIEFEMTETAVAQNPDVVIETLNKLRSIGCTIALDDFGTGHSSLTMLKNIPIDRVKLDKSFIDNLEVHERSFTLVENSIKMMRDLGFLVTVEGIETREVHDMLFALGVDEAQGYFYSKPLPPNEFLEYSFGL